MASTAYKRKVRNRYRSGKLLKLNSIYSKTDRVELNKLCKEAC